MLEIIYSALNTRTMVALASALHHLADRTTRAQHDAPQGQKNAGTEYYELSDEDGACEGFPATLSG